MLQAHQWCPGVAISSEGEWGLKRHGLCPMCAIYRGAVTAWSALGRLAARGIGAALPAELWLFLESCVWLKAGIGLSPVWFLPSRWVNVILECSGENRVSVLCVGLTDFWKDGFNKKTPTMLVGRSETESLHVKVAELLRTQRSHWKLIESVAWWCSLCQLRVLDSAAAFEVLGFLFRWTKSLFRCIG